MGRSKRTWDHLVEADGSYGINIREGIFPGADGNPIKGNTGRKGDRGLDGDKGVKGERGQIGPIGIGLAGDKGKKGEKGAQGSSLKFTDLSVVEQEQLRGQKGAEGAAPLLSFSGSVSTLADLPANAGVSDTYFVESEQAFKAWSGTEWSNIGSVSKGEQGLRGQSIQGEKGANGEKGNRGEDGLKGATGSKGNAGQTAYDIAVEEGFSGNLVEWTNSLKGQKGSNADAVTGDEFTSDDYYDKIQVDGLIHGFKTPEAAFHFDRGGSTITDQVNFRATDRNLGQYNQGCVLLKGGAIRNGAQPPFESTNSILLLNLPVHDPMLSRSNEYKVLQFAYSTTGHGLSLGYCRLAQPSKNIFTSWQPTSFDEGLYYDKTEVNKLLDTLRREINGESESSGLESTFTWENLVRFASNRTLKSLADVEAGNAVVTETNLFETQINELPVVPMTKGTYYCDDTNKTLVISQNNKSASSANLLFENTQIGVSFHRLVSISYNLIAKVTAKNFDGKNYSFTYEDPLSVQTVKINDIGFAIGLLVSYDTADGAVLRYNSASDKWIAELVTEEFTQVEADALYRPLGGDMTVSGSFEASSGARLVGTTTADAVIANTLQLSTEASNANEAITLGAVDAKLSPYLKAQDAEVYLRKDSGLLENNIELTSANAVSTFTVSGHPSKRLQFRIENDNGNTPILTLSDATINCNGLRLLNVGPAQVPSDALNLGVADERYSTKEKVQELEAVIAELDRKLQSLIRG
jgi:hypothetical protein